MKTPISYGRRCAGRHIFLYPEQANIRFHIVVLPTAELNDTIGCPFIDIYSYLFPTNKFSASSYSL